MARLDDMRVFARLAEAGSFSGAARALDLTKQTVSRRIEALEDDLGVQLVRRTTRRVSLTDIGRAYAERCAEVVRLADEANRAVASHAELVAGTLRVTADPTLGETLLPALTTRFAREQPRVSVSVMITSRAVDLYDEGLDVALRVGPPPDVHHLASTRLGPARLVTVASPAYLEARGAPATLAALTGHDCLVATPRPGRAVWPMRVGEAVRMVEVAPRITANGLAVVLDAARAGLGLAHLPAFAVAEDLRRGRLVAVLPEHAADVGGVHVVYPHARLLSPTVTAFVALAVEVVSGAFAVG